MTTRPLFFLLVCITAPFVVSLLLTACGQHTPPQEVTSAGASDEQLSASLKACPEPELEPLQVARARAALPVAYPASELDRPLLLARPFPLADPQFPPTALPRPDDQRARSLPATPPATAPELSPPVVVETPAAPPVQVTP